MGSSSLKHKISLLFTLGNIASIITIYLFLYSIFGNIWQLLKPHDDFYIAAVSNINQDGSYQFDSFQERTDTLYAFSFFPEHDIHSDGDYVHVYLYQIPIGLMNKDNHRINDIECVLKCNMKYNILGYSDMTNFFPRIFEGRRSALSNNLTTDTRTLNLKDEPELIDALGILYSGLSVGNSYNLVDTFEYNVSADHISIKPRHLVVKNALFYYKDKNDINKSVLAFLNDSSISDRPQNGIQIYEYGRWGIDLDTTYYIKKEICKIKNSFVWANGEEVVNDVDEESGIKKPQTLLEWTQLVIAILTLFLIILFNIALLYALIFKLRHKKLSFEQCIEKLYSIKYKNKIWLYLTILMIEVCTVRIAYLLII